MWKTCTYPVKFGVDYVEVLCDAFDLLGVLVKVFGERLEVGHGTVEPLGRSRVDLAQTSLQCSKSGVKLIPRRRHRRLLALRLCMLLLLLSLLLC